MRAAIEPEALSENSVGRRLDPKRLLASGDHRVDFLALEQLRGRSLVSSKELTKKLVLELGKFAALLEMTEIARHHPLDGKLVITAFFEASTRTRLSFESAVLRLDGKVVSVPDGKVTGIAKGESLADIGEMFNTYGDLVIIRHPEDGSIAELQTNLCLPLINAGNGTDEHPSQALIDWYTLLKWRPDLALDDCAEDQRIHLGIIGIPSTMRAVRSFLRTATHFAPALRKITVISNRPDPIDPELQRELAAAQIEVAVATELQPLLRDFDVVYMNSITLLKDGYRELAAAFELSKKSPLKENAVVMHPFARRGELSTDLDRTSHNLYFAQAASAVYIRQALLIALLGRIEALPGSVLYLAK